MPYRKVGRALNSRYFYLSQYSNIVAEPDGYVQQVLFGVRPMSNNKHIVGLQFMLDLV